VNVAPLFLLCDPRDLRAVSQVKSPFTGRPTVFLYDNHPGGVGFSESLYGEHLRLLGAALDLARGCPCDSGCPSCVGPANEVSGDPKAAVLGLLNRVLAGVPA